MCTTAMFFNQFCLPFLEENKFLLYDKPSLLLKNLSFSSIFLVLLLFTFKMWYFIVLQRALRSNCDIFMAWVNTKIEWTFEHCPSFFSFESQPGVGLLGVCAGWGGYENEIPLAGTCFENSKLHCYWSSVLQWAGMFSHNKNQNLFLVTK